METSKLLFEVKPKNIAKRYVGLTIISLFMGGAMLLVMLSENFGDLDSMEGLLTTFTPVLFITYIIFGWVNLSYLKSSYLRLYETEICGKSSVFLALFSKAEESSVFQLKYSEIQGVDIQGKNIILHTPYRAYKCFGGNDTNKIKEIIQSKR